MSQAGVINVAGGGGGGAPVETLTGNSGGPVAPTMNNIIFEGDGTTINVVGTPGTSTLIISAINAGEPWIDSASSFTVGQDAGHPINAGYFCTATQTVTLPATPVQGNFVEIYADYIPTAAPNPDAPLIILCGAVGQIIQYGNQASSSGVTGGIKTYEQGSAVKLIYRAGDTSWHIIPSQGTWTPF